MKQTNRHLIYLYKNYARALRSGDFQKAAYHAAIYNGALKAWGGPAANPTESYLSMGASYKANV